mmetsp:Transcript_232/g.510  ORF Transcript_232/g.510 Transcript_232/m.510 type:complete len:267 (+) Transcript_232:293-1093(+)
MALYPNMAAIFSSWIGIGTSEVCFFPFPFGCAFLSTDRRSHSARSSRMLPFDLAGPAGMNLLAQASISSRRDSPLRSISFLTRNSSASLMRFRCATTLLRSMKEGIMKKGSASPSHLNSPFTMGLGIVPSRVCSLVGGRYRGGPFFFPFGTFSTFRATRTSPNRSSTASPPSPSSSSSRAAISRMSAARFTVDAERSRAFPAFPRWKMLKTANIPGGLCTALSSARHVSTTAWLRIRLRRSCSAISSGSASGAKVLGIMLGKNMKQ